MIPMTYAVGERAKLLAIRTDRFKTELLAVQFACPLEHGAQERSLLLELLRRGTERYPTKAQFYRRLDDLYASSICAYNRRAGDLHLFGYVADVLGDRFVGGESLLSQVVDMLSQLVLHPYLPNGIFHLPYVENEKLHLRDAIRARINNARAYARARCRSLVCEGEPYALSLIGEEETVDALEAQSLTDAWQHLISQVVPTFFYVGNSDPERLAEQLSKAFLTVGRGIELPGTLLQMPEGPVKHAQECMPISQGHLVMGYRTDIPLSHPLSGATVLLNEVFGGSPASKLFLNVREKHGLCYHCSSALDLYKGVCLATAGIKPEKREFAEAAMRAEMEDTLCGQISDIELNAAKRSIDHAFRQMYDQPSALANFYLTRFAVGNEDTVDMRRACVAAVTREELAEAASHLRESAVFFLRGTLKDDEEVAT